MMNFLDWYDKIKSQKNKKPPKRKDTKNERSGC